MQGQIQLVVDCDEDLADLLRETKAGQMNWDPEAKPCVAVVSDGKVACESGSQAKYRLRPLRQPAVVVPDITSILGQEGKELPPKPTIGSVLP